MKNDNLKNQYRVNEQIRAREVRIVGDDVESVVMPLHKALSLAEEKELDLVEISPTAVPPVCRLIEYSKFLYQLKKRFNGRSLPLVEIVDMRREMETVIASKKMEFRIMTAIPFASALSAPIFAPLPTVTPVAMIE